MQKLRSIFISMPYKNKSVAKTYASWKSMIARCYNKTHPAYFRYGGSGIKVCNRWKLFWNFVEDMGFRPNEKVLDKINNKKGYSLKNCRWATYKESTANRSITVYVGGERVLDMAERLNIPHHRIVHRLARGWTKEEIERMPNPIRHGWSKNGVINPWKNYLNSRASVTT